MLHALLVVPILLLGSAQPARAHFGPRDPVAAEITITREADTLWRVDYAFARPIHALVFGPPVLTFRTSAWQILSTGLVLTEESGQERLVSADGPFARAAIGIRAFTDFPPADYVPVLPFSNGGAALFLGFLTGTADLGAGHAPIAATFHLNGRPGEFTILPDAPPGSRPTYAWFGSRQPIDAGHVRLLMDPALPAWLRTAFDATVPAVTRTLTDRLGTRPATPPLVFIAAGELERFDGYSVKGGVAGAQFVLALRGRDLLEETPQGRRRFEQLAAHELAHVWQQLGWPSGWNMAEPWIHEGSAEAMAVSALVEAGIWSESDRVAFTTRAATACTRARGDDTLAALVARGNWAAVYPCGYGIFAAEGVDVFATWTALVTRARRQGGYDQSLLTEVLNGPEPQAP